MFSCVRINDDDNDDDNNNNNNNNNLSVSMRFCARKTRAEYNAMLGSMT